MENSKVTLSDSTIRFAAINVLDSYIAGLKEGDAVGQIMMEYKLSEEVAEQYVEAIESILITLGNDVVKLHEVNLTT